MAHRPGACPADLNVPRMMPTRAHTIAHVLLTCKACSHWLHACLALAQDTALGHHSFLHFVGASVGTVWVRLQAQAPTRCKPLDLGVPERPQLLVIVLVRVKKSTADLPYMCRSPAGSTQYKTSEV
jgi:hypothetical protein